MSQGFDFSIAIGGAAGQGIATPGNILARMFVRRGLHLNAYNAYQSIIRGGHILLTMRVREQEALSHGDHIHLLLCLNQDTCVIWAPAPTRYTTPTTSPPVNTRTAFTSVGCR